MQQVSVLRLGSFNFLALQIKDFEKGIVRAQNQPILITHRIFESLEGAVEFEEFDVFTKSIYMETGFTTG